MKTLTILTAIICAGLSLNAQTYEPAKMPIAPFGKGKTLTLNNSDTVAAYLQVAYMNDTIGVIRTQWQSGYVVYPHNVFDVIYLDENKKRINKLVFIGITKDRIKNK